MAGSSSPEPGRRDVLRQAASVAVAAPVLGMDRAFAEAPHAYSKRAVELVNRSMVIDMLSPLFNEATPDQFGPPLSAEMRKAFLSSGLTCVHNATSMEGPTAREDVLAYIAAWSLSLIHI